MTREEVKIQKDIVLDEIAYLIEKKPSEVAKAIGVRGGLSKRKLANEVIDKLYSDKQARARISELIGEENTKHSNAGGEAISGIISGVGGVIGSVFDYKGDVAQLEAEKERNKAELYKSLFAKKTNWMPIIIIGGVFVLAGIVLAITLKQKRGK